MEHQQSTNPSKMTRTTTFLLVLLFISSNVKITNGFSMTITTQHQHSNLSRREIFARSATAFLGTVTLGGASVSPALAAPEIFTLGSGVKFVIMQQPPMNGAIPQRGDMVAVEYTGYLACGEIFDTIHSEGKSNALLFKLGSRSVIPGLDNMVANMKVGEKVQAVIPSNMAYAEKGVCTKKGDCLVQPGAILVYDVFLKETFTAPNQGLTSAYVDEELVPF